MNESNTSDTDVTQPDIESAKLLVENFKQLYQTLNKDNVHSGLLQNVYAHNINFVDSFHDISGIDSFTDYCESIYENVIYSRFDFHDEMISDHQAMLTWTMHYAHPRLNGGKDISVKGTSHIKFFEKVFLHQDYVDGGKLLYEHVPVLSWVIKKLKSRMI
jgi:hypothetical protein